MTRSSSNTKQLITWPCLLLLLSRLLHSLLNLPHLCGGGKRSGLCWQQQEEQRVQEEWSLPARSMFDTASIGWKLVNPSHRVVYP